MYFYLPIFALLAWQPSHAPHRPSPLKELLTMKKLAILLLLSVVLTGAVVGCSKDPGSGVPATPEEIKNDPAVNEPGNV